MRNIQRVLCGLGLFGASIVVGCNGGDGGDSTGEPVGSGQARIILAAQGSASANLHLTVTNDTTLAVALDKTVDVDANGSVILDVSLDEASYTLHLDAFADASQATLISSGDAHLSIDANASAQVVLAADTSGGINGGASGGVSVNISALPVVKGVTVINTDAGVTINVDADAGVEGGLNFFWSGFGLDTAIQGTSSLTIAADASLDVDADATAHLIIQNSAGATVSLDIDLTTTVDGKICVFCDGGGSTSIDVDASIDANVDVNANVDILACLQARVQCDLACQAALLANPLNVAASLQCVADCGLELATCEAAAAD